jgi:membrane associated rhomboid family serine protease
VVRVRPGARPDPSTTLGIIGVTVAMFILSVLTPGDRLFDLLAMDNRAVADGEVWRMVTVVLLHANLVHIWFNMWALWVLGPQIEREVGGLRFVLLYLASAATGSAFAFWLGGPLDLGVGASGAIFGLFGVWLASAVRRRHTAYGRYLLSQLGFVLLINAAIPFVFPNVSWQAHLGGLLAGFVLGNAWAVVKGPGRPAWQAVTALVLLAASLLSPLLLSGG